MTDIDQPAMLEFEAHEETDAGDRVRKRVRISTEGRSLVLSVGHERWLILVENAGRWPSADGGKRHPLTRVGGTLSTSFARLQRTIEIDCGNTPPTMILVERKLRGEVRSRRLRITHPDQDRTLDLIERHIATLGLPALPDRHSSPNHADPALVG